MEIEEKFRYYYDFIKHNIIPFLYALSVMSPHIGLLSNIGFIFKITLIIIISDKNRWILGSVQ